MHVAASAQACIHTCMLVCMQMRMHTHTHTHTHDHMHAHLQAAVDAHAEAGEGRQHARLYRKADDAQRGHQLQLHGVCGLLLLLRHAQHMHGGKQSKKGAGERQACTPQARRQAVLLGGRGAGEACCLSSLHTCAWQAQGACSTRGWAGNWERTEAPASARTACRGHACRECG